MRPLRRRRLDDDVLEPPVAALMGEARARGPGPQDHLERLLEARLGLLRRNAETLELAVAVALADAEVEPAAGDEVEGRGLLGEQDRVVPGQGHDGGPEPQRVVRIARQVSSMRVAET